MSESNAEKVAQMAREIGSTVTDPQQPAPQPAPQQQSQGMTMDDVLQQVDPRDSDSALAMLDWLMRTGRLQRVGVLDGGQGYMFVYGEPQGSSRQGYRPGGTQGDRIVNEALAKQREQGPRGKQGMCPHCFSIVTEQPDGTVVGDNGAECKNPDGHAIA